MQRDYDKELINSTRPQHELNDSPWVWLAAPILLLTVLLVGYVRMKIGV
jgi:hypothetical protein